MNDFPGSLLSHNANGSTEQQHRSPDEHRISLSSGRKRILLVEDDTMLTSFLVAELGLQEFLIDTAHDGQAALQLLRGEHSYDLLILDFNLPKLDGMGVLREINTGQYRVPILMLTARSRVEDKVRALQCGADDYLVKPFSWMEFQARVQVLLRRHRHADPTDAIPNCSKVGDLYLYREERRVERNGRRIELTPREFAILEFMMRRPGLPVTRAALLQEIWHMPPDPSTNIVDVYMKYVRDKVDGPGEVKLTHTIRGVGYELREG